VHTFGLSQIVRRCIVALPSGGINRSYSLI
jgi:hypothetical protein